MERNESVVLFILEFDTNLHITFGERIDYKHSCVRTKPCGKNANDFVSIFDLKRKLQTKT